MAYPVSLGIAAGTALAGAVLGVQFGRSAVAQVDPVYYRASDEYRGFAHYSATYNGYDADPAGTGTDTYAECAGCDDFGTGQRPWFRHAVFSDAELGITDLPAYTAPRVEENQALYDPPQPEPAVNPAPLAARYAHYAVDASETAPRSAPPAADETPRESEVPVGM